MLLLEKKPFHLLLTIAILFLIGESSFSQIQIEDISTTESTCPNNGSITITATGTNPPLYYSIASGPVTEPVQTENTFKSLPSGNYKVKVSDGAGNEAIDEVTVTGNYLPLDFMPEAISPRCAGGSDGKIIGNKTANSGKGPYTWEIIDPSPVTRPVQESDTFGNLTAGDYTVRLTDACGSYKTLVTSISEADNEFRFRLRPSVSITGCDSVMVHMAIGSEDFHFPYTYTFETANDTFITTTPTLVDDAGGPSYYIVQQTLSGVTYGDFLKITVTNACGNTISVENNIKPLDFCATHTEEFKDCNFIRKEVFGINNCINNSGLFTTYANAPLQYQFSDAETGVIIDAGIVNRISGLGFLYGASQIKVESVPGGKSYVLSVTDACGNNFTETFFIPATEVPQPKVAGITIEEGFCLDSVASAYIRVENFKTKPLLVMLSGPEKMVSSKPGYSYSDTYSYPDTLPNTGYSPTRASYSFSFGNLAAGSYHFKVIDSCGTEVLDSFVVEPADVSDLDHSFSYKKGCLGKNQLHYSAATSGGYILIREAGSLPTLWYKGHSLQSFSLVKDSILNVPHGTYVLNFHHRAPGLTFNDTDLSCAVATDTVKVPEYQTPEIITSNAIACQSRLAVEIVPDSSKGVPPYKYEIISGPETFSVQSSNIFTFKSPGTYTARIHDQCGNASTKELTVSDYSFEPLSADLTCEQALIVYPSSDYYTYKWEKPDGATFTGDSMIADPVTAADTGLYKVSRIVEINGCKDTLQSSHHVSLAEVHEVSDTICAGQSVEFGTGTYTATGIYSDTLLSLTGCDSIIQLDLTVLDYKKGTFEATVCPGESILVNGYSYSAPGVYYDTLSTTDCDSIVTIQISASPAPSVDLGADTSFCQGDSLVLDAGSGYQKYYWNDAPLSSGQHTFTVYSVGKYRVRVENMEGCTGSDTIEIEEVYPLPVADAGEDRSICAGESVVLSAFGGDYYEWAPTGVQQQTLTVTPGATTTYSVTAYNAHECASVADEVTVYVRPLPSRPLFSSEFREHCFEQGPLSLGPDRGESFFWPETGDTTQTITVNKAGSYKVKVSDEYGCSVSGQVMVVDQCASGLYVPDAFSPNYDGLHDDFEIFGRNIRDFEIKIFNRWGEIIFISTDINKRWDGSYRGEAMPVGSYPWVIYYKSNETEEMKARRGSVTLVR